MKTKIFKNCVLSLAVVNYQNWFGGMHALPKKAFGCIHLHAFSVTCVTKNATPKSWIFGKASNRKYLLQTLKLKLALNQGKKINIH